MGISHGKQKSVVLIYIAHTRVLPRAVVTSGSVILRVLNFTFGGLPKLYLLFRRIKQALSTASGASSRQLHRYRKQWKLNSFADNIYLCTELPLCYVLLNALFQLATPVRSSVFSITSRIKDPIS
jgi:hypothetical protein